MSAYKKILSFFGIMLTLLLGFILADYLETIPGVEIIVVVIVLVGGSIYAMNTIFYERHQKAVMSFILGMVNCISWFFPYVGVPFAISGIVFSVQGRESSRGKFSRPGLIMNIVALCFSLMMIVFNILVFMNIITINNS